jgi:hypothetical protein
MLIKIVEYAPAVCMQVVPTLFSTQRFEFFGEQDRYM